ncbi:MAG: tripartite tricarboxylate transporter substrate binding protein [Pseudomonadota bacterium]
MATRRTFIVAAAGACALPLSAWAAFPDRPIRMVVMISPGTGTDAVARFIATGMSKQLNTPVVVENKAGAGGTIGTEFVAKAPADGYTVLITNGGHFTTPWLYEKLAYDPQADFTPVAQVASSALAVAVPAASPYQTMREMLDDAKKRPGKLSFSSAGQGSASHLTGALMWSVAGVNVQHVPYKSSSQAVMDAASGQVDIAVNGMAGVMPLVKGGKIRVLAVTSLKRSELLPTVPTLDEVGLRDYEVISPIFALARTGTPDSVVSALSSAIAVSAGSPEFKDLCHAQGLDVDIRGSAALQSAMPKEFARWKKMVVLTGAKAE